MWLEVKIVFSVISMVFIAIVLSQILFYSVLLAFLLFASIALIVLGDMVIGYQIKHNHLDKLMDPCPANRELGIVFTITGLLDFVWANKKPHGKREFVYHSEEASYINHGDYPIHTINGNHGCLVHESHDENVNLFEAKAAEQIVNDYDTKNIKEVYYKTKLMERGG